MPSAVAVVDAGPLYAATNSADSDHARSVQALRRTDLQLVIAALAVTEVTQILGRRHGPRAEASFLAGLAGFQVESPTAEDWARVAELVERYADFPLGGVDASVVALAERLGTPTVLTLDHRHFAAVRPSHCEALQLLPE
ncbi:MAG: PIN domain-containing protein [Solirubrobacterales bacterium]|nr:PIN domain-containing protein [Solirubrobacterales bacterium]